MYSKNNPKIGEIYAVSFEKKAGEQAGWRPAVVIQNKLGNEFSKNIVVLPITSTMKRTDMITHVELKAAETGLRNDSIVLGENPVTLPKSYLRKYITTLSDDYIKKIAKAYILASGLIAYLENDELNEVWNEAKKINNFNSEEGA